MVKAKGPNDVNAQYYAGTLNRDVTQIPGFYSQSCDQWRHRDMDVRVDIEVDADGASL